VTSAHATRSHAAWWAALAGFAVTLLLFHPGWLSVDSAVQLWHARTGAYTSDHPVAMAMLWSWIDPWWPGSGGLFVLFAAGYWSALAWLAFELFRGARAQLLTVLLIGLWPANLGMVAHLWKDIPTAFFALWACALLLRERRRPSRRLRWLVPMVLLGACLFRHNALPFVLPLLWYWSGRWPRLHGSPVQRTVATLAATAVIAVVAALPNKLPAVTERAVWPLLQTCDLAALSVRTGQMLIPRSMQEQPLQVDELRAVLKPYALITAFETRKLVIATFQDLTAQQRADLDRAWWSAWRDHPGEFLRHRAQMTGLLLGLRQSQMPLSLTIAPGRVAAPVGPAVEAAWPWDAAVMRAFSVLATTPLFAAWPYLLAGIALVLSSLRRPVHALFWPVMVSAMCFAAPLPLLAASAEYRYLFWPVLAVMVAAALRLAGPDAPERPRRPDIGAYLPQGGPH
jgi:hypothetical protein